MPKIKKNINSVSKRHLQRLARIERNNLKNRQHVIPYSCVRSIPDVTSYQIGASAENFNNCISRDDRSPIANSCCQPKDMPIVTDDNSCCQPEDMPIVTDDSDNNQSHPADSNTVHGFISAFRSHNSLLGESADHTATDSTSNNLGLELCNWASESCVSQKHLSSLLKILRRYEHDRELPSDARTLVKTPRTVNLVEMHPGKYYHFGLSDGLTRSVFSNYSLENLPDKIKINTHVGGLPLSKSSGTQLWPILVSIDDNFYTEPFVAGAYVGNTKPSDANDFLRYYVEDVENITAMGLLINGKKIAVEIHLFIGDAPAIAYIKCTKSFNACHGCGRCEVEGEFVKNRMTFPDTNAPLRTDESFACKTDEDYHKRTPILEKLGVKMVAAFPSESQHLVYQGVTKKIARFSVKGKQGVRMTPTDIEAASAHLLSLKKVIPKEFARSPRSLHEVDRFKATEFRQLLLYTGPVIFRNRLDNDRYNHFLSLSIAIRILASEEFHIEFNDYARNLLEYFVKNYGTLYGAEHVTYNVHNLIHLCDDVLRLGPLDAFSSFKYENYLQKLKKKIKTSGNELQQLVNRIKEQSRHHIRATAVKREYPIIKFNGPIEGRKHVIKSLKYDGYVCNLKRKNNCVYTHDRSIILIQGIYLENEIIHISGRKYMNPTAMFEKPCDSTIFNIWVVLEDKFSLITLPAKEIKQKCVKLPLNPDESAVFPLIHQD